MADYNDVLQTAADLGVLASDRANAASKIIHDVANGPETETVTTESGEVNTLAKAIKDITDRIEAASLSPEIEMVEIQAGVLEYTLTDTDTSGMALYIDGAREFDFTVVDSTTFRLPREFPTGTRAWVVKRDIYTPNQEESGTDAATLNGYTSDQFLRADTDNTYQDRFIFGIDVDSEGTVRIERDAANSRFRMLPADTVASDWDYTDGFGYENGRWYFDNAPTVDNGSEIWHSGNDGEGSGLDADFLRGLDPDGFGQTASTNTWQGAQIYTDATTGEDAGVIRANFNGTRFSMVPHDGTDWDYNDEFGYEAGRWYFDNTPQVNGNDVYHAGNLDLSDYPSTSSNNTWTAAQIWGDGETTANSIRQYASSSKFNMVPSDGTAWDYNDEFGHENGEWFFDNVPLLGGAYPVMEGDTANVTSVFSETIESTTDLNVSFADSFIVDNTAAVTLNIIGMDTAKHATISILIEGASGYDFQDSITWTDGTKPSQGASWTILVLTHFPGRGWYGSLGGRG